MITLLNMIFANPIAYLIFPNMVNTYNTSTTTEYAVYSGYLNLYKDNKLVKLFTGTSTIDLSDVSGRIRFDNVTDTYSAVVGEWDLAKSQDLVMEDNIRQAMVLWYDIAKQGATNENMAENPVLRDLSGNGHDATCYNFAWSGMSGVDGYAINFSKRDSTLTDSDIYTLTDNKLIINYLSSTSAWLLIKGSKVISIPRSTCKVTGLEDSGINLIYYYMDEINVRSRVNLTEGLNELPESILFPDATSGTQIGLFASNIPTDTNIDLTIELLPLYPHALVSDGVDDYCLVEGLPLLNKEDGYTVIAKRKWIENTTQTSALSSKRDIDNSIDGAFQFEYTTQNRRIEMNFGVDTNIDFIQEDISWATSQQYNNMSIRIGRGEDSDIMQLFRSIPDGVYAKIALYAFFIFNRDLSTDEIEWVKTNLIETEQ